MASKRMIRRENKRSYLQRFRVQRDKLRLELKDPAVDVERKFEILASLEKMPKDASHVRQRRRCAVTGRSRGNYRKFGLCRNEIRRCAMLGEIPGLVKASW